MDGAKPTLKVWDLPVRLFHWTLLALVAFSWWTGARGGDSLALHERSGYAVLTLVAFRVLWGFAGSDTARFKAFVRGPHATFAYARSLIARRRGAYLGHNPLGGWMVLALLGSLLLQAGSGLFATDDVAFAGPFAHHISERASEIVTQVHKLNFDVLLALIGLHAGAVLTHIAVRRDALLSAMLSGRKPAPVPAPVLRFASPARAALLLGVAALLVYGLTRLG